VWEAVGGLFEHDWVTTDGLGDGEELLLLSADPKEDVYFQNGWKISIEDMRGMLEEQDELNLEEEGEELGCEECMAPGSTCRVVAEARRSGEKRMRVICTTMCSCMSMHGAPEPAEEEEWIYSVRPPPPAKPEKGKGAKPSANKKQKR
jgi:hypothetical protein